MTGLRIDGLTVRFRGDDGRTVTALDDVSFDVPPGQFVVLIGPSGHGKSTLLRAIAGLVEPTEGQILLDDVPVTGPGRERGLVFQEDTVFPWLRVIDSVRWSLELRGVAEPERTRLALELLVDVGLEGAERAWPKELSGGMRKRVALATTLASDPGVLLMDEPFGPLDFLTRTTMHLLLLRLWNEHRRTVVFVTHDVDEAVQLADRIVVVRDGAIAEDTPVDFVRPRSDDLRADPDAIALRSRLLRLMGAPTAEGAAA